jgi:hypothetical protein
LADIRILVKAWQELLVREMLEASESSLVHITVEDRRPGDEVKLCFQAAQAVLHRFLQSLSDRGLKFTCHELVPGLLTLCRITREKTAVQLIGPKGGSG